MSKSPIFLCGSALAVLQLMLSSASAETLSAISGIPNAAEYDAFWVIDESVSSARTDRVVAVVPRLLEFDRREDGSERIGVQYAYETGQPAFAQLTASLRLAYDSSKVASILEFIRGNSPGTGTISSALPGSLKYEVSFYYQEGGTYKKVNGSVTSAGLQSSVAVSVDLSDLSKSELLTIFSQSNRPDGFIATVSGGVRIVAGVPSSMTWPEVVNWATSKKILTADELNKPDSPQVMLENTKRRTMALALGPPSVIVDGPALVIGWPTATPENQKIFDELKSKSDSAEYRTVSEQYRRNDFVSVNDICSKFESHVVDLASGEAGCGGLTR
ncbi:hypothetical protein ELH33_32915 (plasmid) [Rhizobium ruizarguesonis]|uniref:hypothetical protein n=1 Tax=Rhizobium ruizarguesonis TaxID=2081791 RepID=UPI00102F969C|nr:hypothetical protein [Rhizobium ruizarguesonis]TBC25581.1 hypothetical protein ELH33_32915 [Rhizobium ruizarguesonis]